MTPHPRPWTMRQVWRLMHGTYTTALTTVLAVEFWIALPAPYGRPAAVAVVALYLGLHVPAPVRVLRRLVWQPCGRGERR
ncbi:hypothetical protein ABGB17_30400 [Sphaerisporangium sp. B11E5]|uniref:hypothetical protein n=1 Tax=Sphaerisporangium sp. B11E5 TaxID=3153563 RepID=UPI00325E9035